MSVISLTVNVVDPVINPFALYVTFVPVPAVTTSANVIAAVAFADPSKLTVQVASPVVEILLEVASLVAVSALPAVGLISTYAEPDQR